MHADTKLQFLHYNACRHSFLLNKREDIFYNVLIYACKYLIIFFECFVWKRAKKCLILRIHLYGICWHEF